MSRPFQTASLCLSDLVRVSSSTHGLDLDAEESAPHTVTGVPPTSSSSAARGTTSRGPHSYADGSEMLSICAASSTVTVTVHRFVDPATPRRVGRAGIEPARLRL